MSTRRLTSLGALAWDYAYFIDLSSDGDRAVLHCGTEADTPEFEVDCPSLSALEPYLEIHRAWRAAPDAVEPPLIPFIPTRSGRRIFSTEGANYDFPCALSPL